MNDFRPGDRVRVSFEAKVTNIHSDGDRLWVYHAGVSDTYLNVSDVELIEAVDDPSKDPIGTVRNSAPERRGGNWVKRETRVVGNLWAYASGHCAHYSMVIHDSDVQGWPIIGAVPGTPAWDAWQKGELRGAPEFPGASQPVPMEERAERVFRPNAEPWTGDGSVEPPWYVKKVQDKHGCVVERAGGGWNWVSGEWSGNPKRAWTAIACGPYVEVVDE